MSNLYCVSVDVTMAKNIYVEADSEEQAMSIVRDKIDKDPYDCARDFSHYVGYKIVDVVEEEDN